MSEHLSTTTTPNTVKTVCDLCKEDFGTTDIIIHYVTIDDEPSAVCECCFDELTAKVDE